MAKSCVSFSKREFIYLKLIKFSTASTQTIRVEAGRSIPYLGFRWDLSSSVKSLISEAGLYNIRRVPAHSDFFTTRGSNFFASQRCAIEPKFFIIF
jgi:hypothetical protein